MNKLLMILLTMSVLLNLALLAKSGLFESAYPFANNAFDNNSLTNNGAKKNATDKASLSDTPHIIEQDALNMRDPSSDLPFSASDAEALEKNAPQQYLIYLERLFAERYFQDLELALRTFLNRNPSNQDALMLEAKLIMHTQTLNYALTHYYNLLSSGAAVDKQSDIESIILQQTTKVIQQLTSDGAWEILATFLEPLLQVDPLNKDYILGLARAYGMQNQSSLMENVLAAMSPDDPLALRLRKQINRRVNKDTSENSSIDNIISAPNDNSWDIETRQADAIAQLSDNNQLITQLKIISKKAVMLLDTGASTTAIKSSVLDSIANKDKEFVGYFSVQTAAGGIRAPLYRITSIEFGNTTFSNVSVIALPDDSTRKFDGLLGMNILKSFEMRFDQSQQHMALYKN